MGDVYELGDRTVDGREVREIRAAACLLWLGKLDLMVSTLRGELSKRDWILGGPVLGG